MDQGALCGEIRYIKMGVVRFDFTGLQASNLGRIRFFIPCCLGLEHFQSCFLCDIDNIFASDVHQTGLEENSNKLLKFLIKVEQDF